MPTYTLAQTAKTWAALIGAIVTALLGAFTAGSVIGKILTAAGAIGTAIAVYTMPNAPTQDSADWPEVYQDQSSDTE